MNEEQIRQIVVEELVKFFGGNTWIFQKNIQILDARDIQLGRTSGTMIGTATDQKLAFFGATPITQLAAIAAPSGGATQDAVARAAINSILAALGSSTGYGLTA